MTRRELPFRTLSVGLVPGSDGMVLIVNGFERISGPSWYDHDGMAGVEWWSDRGEADRYNFVSVGDQYDFDRKSPWTDDDNAGWGSSYADREGRVIAGNSFDFTCLHGLSVMASGKSFISVSDEVFNGEDFDMKPWCTVDLLFGEEKATASAYYPEKTEFRIYSPGFMRSLEKLRDAAVPVFASGAYIGTDLVMLDDTAVALRVMKILHFKPRTDHAVKNGKLYATDAAAAYLPATTASIPDRLIMSTLPRLLMPSSRLTSSHPLHSDTPKTIPRPLS